MDVPHGGGSPITAPALRMRALTSYWSASLIPTELAPQATASPRSRVATFNVGRKVRGGTVALPLGSRVKAIAKQVQEYPGHLCILSNVDHPRSAAHSRKRSF